MDLNAGNKQKNVDNNLEYNNLSKYGSSVDDPLEIKKPSNQDVIFIKSMIVSEAASNFSCESNFSEDTDSKNNDSIEKTRICIPLSIETKNTNAFLLTKHENSKSLKNEVESKFENSSEGLEKVGKKKLNKKDKNYNGKKKNKKVKFEKKKKKKKRKFSLCSCLKTKTIEKSTNFTETKTPETKDIVENTSKNIILNKTVKKEFLEGKPKNIEQEFNNAREKPDNAKEKLNNAKEKLKNTEKKPKNTEPKNKENNNKIYEIYSETILDKKTYLDETKLNIVNDKSQKSKSLENIYKLFEYKINIEIPKFNNSMDLGFLSKKFEEKEMSQKSPKPIKSRNFNEKEISDIISDTLNWYEIHKLDKVEKLEYMLNN